MKNLFKNNAKAITATALAVVVTVSMSFTAPQTIDIKTNEVASVETSKSFINKAPTLTAFITGTCLETTTSTLNLIGGKTCDENSNSLNEIVQLKLSQLDIQ